MRITEINITDFGCFSDKRLTPSAGMNIIYGENESGKSTLLLFIKFMLYGLGRRSSSNTDRERSVSWSGRSAAGSMTLECESGSYRIERRFSANTRGGSEALNVIRLPDGESVPLDCEPGEYFFGVGKEVFESTACVSQMRAADINGEKTATGIQNLLSSADESVDTADVLKKLDGVRVGYRHKNRAGGSLYEDEQKISELQKRLQKAEEDALAVEMAEQKFRIASRDLKIAKENFEKQELLVSQFNKITVLRRFEACRRREDELSGLQASLDKCKKQNLKTDFMPDEGHIAALKLSAEAYASALDRKESALREKSKAREGKLSAELCALGERLESAGGKEAVLSTFEKEKSKKKKNKTALVLWVVLGLLAAACGAMGCVLGFYVFAAAFAVPLISVFAAVMLVRDTKKCGERIAALLDEYGVIDGKLAQRLEECRAALVASRALQAELAVLEASVVQAQSALAASSERLSSLLSLTLPESVPDAGLAMEEHYRLSRFINEYSSIQRSMLAAESVINSDLQFLADYNEDELRTEISVDISQITPEDVARADREKSFAASKKATYEQKVASLNESIVRLRASGEDPIALGDELKALEESYGRDTEFYSALTLAMESIERAGQVMGGSVIPEIAHRAGELLSRISDSRYSILRSNASLGVSLDSNGFIIKPEYFSGGTRDAVYLALRISLLMRMFTAERAPLILDEALCQLDDKRAAKILELLGSLSTDGMQCLLFTSHKREAALAAEQSTDFELIEL